MYVCNRCVMNYSQFVVYNQQLSITKVIGQQAMSCQVDLITSDMRQLKTILTIDKRGSKIARNSVFDCHLSPVRRQMAVKTLLYNYFLI